MIRTEEDALKEARALRKELADILADKDRLPSTFQQLWLAHICDVAKQMKEDLGIHEQKHSQEFIDEMNGLIADVEAIEE